MIITETFILSAILIFSWSEYFWELYLLLRQLKIYKTNTTIPDVLKDMLNAETFEKARLYAMDKLKYRLVKEFYDITISSIILYAGWFAVAWMKSEQILHSLSWSESEIITSCIFLVFMTFFNFVVNIPFTIYSTFVLEEKHGFNKQTAGFFVKDQIKSVTVSLVISLPIAAIIIYIISLGGNMFVVWLWLFTTIVTMVLLTIYPSVIAPFFDKFTPLPDGTLRKGIEALASKLKFPLGQIFIVEGSKRSAHSNAYFSGMFGAKRIVLYDTLIEKFDEEKKTTIGCTEDEILGVLAHELGHWQCNHLYKGLALTELNLLLLFTAFGFLFKYSLLYTTLGFPAGQEPIIIGLIVVLQLILAPYNAILSFLMTILTRKNEYEADEFAVSLNYAPQLETALIKLSKDNLEYPVYDKLYSTWHHSHPTLLHRIENIRNKKRD